MTDNTQPSRWYMVDKDGMATLLCLDREDAEKEAKKANMAWPHTAPHRAVQLVEASFDSADMATDAAQGFRDGVASVAAGAGSEPVAWRIDWPDEPELGHYFAEKPTDSGRCQPLYTHPSPPEGMVGGWRPIETAPVAGLILLVVEDSAGERRVFPAEASHENGVWVWQVTLGWLGWTRLHSGWTPILWRRIPPPPTSPADSRKGE